MGVSAIRILLLVVAVRTPCPASSPLVDRGFSHATCYLIRAKGRSVSHTLLSGSSWTSAAQLLSPHVHQDGIDHYDQHEDPEQGTVVARPTAANPKITTWRTRRRGPGTGTAAVMWGTLVAPTRPPAGR
jgi:hypothetical protein